jgi:hypothetical protein
MDDIRELIRFYWVSLINKAKNIVGAAENNSDFIGVVLILWRSYYSTGCC